MIEPKKSKGKVHLVGSGPGNPGLITRQGYDLLQTCDAVVYDNLIPIELIVNLPPATERYYVGKRAGKHSKTQPEINALLVELAEKGMNIVRLKGGDPSVFGRVGEETAYLSEHGIAWTIIPGVTAASAGAAEAGFSLTDRRHASWTVLATGHEAISGSPSVPWHSLGSLRGGTFVIYMGIGGIESIVRQLLEGAHVPNTPVRVQQNISHGNSRSVVGSLANIVELCRSERVKPPALVFIGEATADIPAIQAENELPLHGKRILVTRPAGQTDTICQQIRDLGGEPIPYPTIALTSDYNEDDWKNFGKLVSNGGWLVFTSEAGVRFFFEQYFENKFDIRALGKVKIAAIGTGTSSALAKRGIAPDLMPEKALVSELAKSLAQEADIAGKIIVRVRGNLGDSSVEDKCAEAGAEVYPLTVYSNSTAQWEEYWIAALLEQPPDYITFTSGSTVDGFVEILGKHPALEIAKTSSIAVIGPMTERIAVQHGFDVSVIAREYNVDGLVKAIVEDISGM